jgi:hypothetical protein
VIGPHESSISRPEEKFGVDERAEQRIAGGSIEAPQPLRLCRGQAEAGHLYVFALHTLKHVERLLLCSHSCSLLAWIRVGPLS